MNYRTILLVIVSVVLLVVVTFIVYKQSVDNAEQPLAEQTTEQQKTDFGSEIPNDFPTDIPIEEEIALQQQVQDIIEYGKASDCSSLANELYRVGCNQFFSGAQNKGVQLVPIESKATSLQDLMKEFPLKGISYVTSTKNILIIEAGVQLAQPITK